MNILSFFTKSGVPATGLVPLIKIIEVPSGVVTVNNQPMSELSSGFYYYLFAAYDITKDYAILCDGTAALAASERYVVASNENYIAALIKSEISSLIKLDPSIELASVPADTAPLADQIQFIFQYFRNKRTVTNNLETIFKDDGATALGTSTLADDGTTFTKSEMS